MRSRLLLAGALVAAATAALGAPASALAAGTGQPAVKHVWIVQLENKSYDEAFVNNGSSYLWKDLPAQGALLRQYYGIGHLSLDNYVAQLSGLGPNGDTQADCANYTDVRPGTQTGVFGQVAGVGCVYPNTVKTLPDELESAGLSWKGYMEDMGKAPAREQATCGLPLSGGRPVDPAAVPPPADGTQAATATDQYAARHNPFLYFHSIIDNPVRCAAHVVPLEPALQHDLASTSSTPSFSFVTPNLCNDAHDATCVGPNVAGGTQGGLFAADLWLKKYLPMITGSPAFADGGLLVVTFDESDISSTSDTSIAAACCGEVPAGAASAPNGLSGPGGGRVGAVVLSPYVTPGTVSDVGYNHYSLLRTIEDLYGLAPLGYSALPVGARAATTTQTAETAAFVPFGPDVFTNPTGAAAGGPAPVVPESPAAALLPVGALLLLGAGAAVHRRRGRARC